MAALPHNQSIDDVLAARAGGVGIPWKIFLFSLIVFGAVAASYAGIALGYRPYVAAKLSDTSRQIESLAAAIPEKDQQELIAFYSQIVNLKSLLDRHTAVGKMPAFWEARTNARVAYTNVRVDMPRRELQLEGIADSYVTLTEQLEALNQAAEVERYLLTDSRTPDGRVHFRITVTFAPTLLQPQ